MAQLHRFVALRDRHDTCVFTFLLSRRVTKPLSPDIFTRDFACAHQRWCLSFVRREKHLSVYLVLKEAADGLQVALDYSITILNREHFSRNEGFNVRACVFSRERDTHGRKMFVSIDDLLGRQFTDGNSEYVIELTIGGALTTFTHRLRMPDLTRATGFPKYETTYFSFGSYDWSVSMFPHGDSDDNVGRPLVYLTRHTHFEHLCKLKYELTLGEGAACMDSDTIQHVFDISGTGEGYVLNNVSVASLLRQAELYVALKLLSVGTVSEVRIPVLDRGRNCATLYDRDKQAWAVVSEFDRGTLKLRLFYSDARNVPRNYLRYVAWNAVVVTATGDTVPVSDGPFYRYYVQVECDDGYDMTTNIQENDFNNCQTFS
ncbi:PREDICTED: uncharacterized protein LOC106811267 [Priapulus caudatus]|uniref:Uncharacterized protein LOC106811267 n=1 Tax=Priapulus caudatus TaxID=37621 RepID=A0ABM1EDP5_PRICU|nr:PREDICTED: uncharacterized protein LOC106811267 [Priapulus caudatus]